MYYSVSPHLFFVCQDFLIYLFLYFTIYVFLCHVLNANYVASSELDIKHYWLVWYDL